MRDAVIIEAVRTPIGRKDGKLAGLRADELQATVIDALLARTGIDGARIDDVIVGCVTQTGEQGANIGRQAALLSSLPMTVSATTLTRLCGSSQQAIHFGAQAILAGDARYVIAGGVETMSRVPMFSDIGGGFERLNPKLQKKYDLVHQGESAERIAARWKLSRVALDRFSAESHVKAGVATQEGRFKSQIVPVAGLDIDEGVRAQPNLEKMAQLKTIFRADGVVTAANASQISDGAAAVLIADRETAVADGLKPIARIRTRVCVGGDPTLQLMEVIPATKLALERAKLELADIGVIEINEAFASVVLAWGQEVQPDWFRVNPNGGAIAHGHPLGATGAALMTKLVHELQRTKKQFGLQVMCIGHGMATATIIERL